MLNGVVGWLWNPRGLTPHGFCLLWQPGLIWTYAISDLAIGAAYLTIPLALAIVARRRRDLIFRPLFYLFAAFILLCGTTHLLDVLTLWVAAYGIEAVAKAATAVVSCVTAILLWRFLPRTLVLPSPEQLRRVNATLREREERHRLAFENSPVPLHILDGKGYIRAVSKSWLAMFGYSEAEVIGQHVRTFQAPDSPVWLPETRERLMTEGQVLDMPRRFVRRDGAVLDLLMSARLERLEEAASIVCVTIDVSDRKRAEAALQASEERLRQAQKMEAVGQLTGGIAHDFNNMLQGIGGCLEVIERRIALNRAAETERYLTAARQTVDRAAALTHRLLAFGRRQALQPEGMQPEHLVLGMEELLRSTIGPAISLQLRLEDSRWTAFCDANQLESALLNLAINARDAMPQGGVLKVEAADRSLTAAQLEDQTEAKPGDYVELAVSDTGTGMTPEVMDRVFEPFFTTKPIGQGSGLGLSQIYGFVQQSGGFIRLESEPGRGTTVRLYLPRHDPRAAAEATERPAVKAAAAPPPYPTRDAARVPVPPACRVLVVDDSLEVRTLMAELLEEIGCIVTEAEDGPEGLLALQNAQREGSPFHLLISDIGLPGLDGGRLVEAARALDARLPILLVTGYAGSAPGQAALPADVVILRKPFGLEELAAQASALLHEKAAVSP